MTHSVKVWGRGGKTLPMLYVLGIATTSDIVAVRNVLILTSAVDTASWFLWTGADTMKLFDDGGFYLSCADIDAVCDKQHFGTVTEAVKWLVPDMTYYKCTAHGYWGWRGSRGGRMGTRARPSARTASAPSTPAVGSTVQVIDGDNTLLGTVLRTARTRFMPYGVLVRFSKPLYGSHDWWFSSDDYDAHINGWRMP